MVEPISLTIATLLAVKAANGFAEAAGTGAWHALDTLRDLVWRRVRSDENGAGALERMEAQPADPERVRAVATAVAEHLASDQDFRDEVAAQLDELRREPGMDVMVTKVSDNAQVGKIVNIRDIHGPVTF